MDRFGSNRKIFEDDSNIYEYDNDYGYDDMDSVDFHDVDGDTDDSLVNDDSETPGYDPDGYYYGYYSGIVYDGWVYGDEFWMRSLDEDHVMVKPCDEGCDEYYVVHRSCNEKMYIEDVYSVSDVEYEMKRRGCYDYFIDKIVYESEYGGKDDIVDVLGCDKYALMMFSFADAFYDKDGGLCSFDSIRSVVNDYELSYRNDKEFGDVENSFYDENEDVMDSDSINESMRIYNGKHSSDLVDIIGVQNVDRLVEVEMKRGLTLMEAVDEVFDKYRYR